jgi:hypothetical protein
VVVEAIAGVAKKVAAEVVEQAMQRTMHCNQGSMPVDQPDANHHADVMKKRCIEHA